MRAFNKNGITLGLQEAKGISEWVYLSSYAEEEAKKEFAKRQKRLTAKAVQAADDSAKEQLLRRSLLKERDYILMKIKDVTAAHVLFSGRDLRGVRIKGADLSNAVLDYTCLYKAELQDTVLHRIFLGNVDLRGANLQGAHFGEPQA